MISQIKALTLIKSNKLFAHIENQYPQFNFNQKSLKEISEGEIIFQPEDSAEQIYLILEGKVKIKHRTYIDGQRIFIKQDGDFFGEKEFIEHQKRDSSSVAETNCTLYLLYHDDIDSLTSQDKRVLNNLQGIEYFEVKPSVIEEKPPLELTEDNSDSQSPNIEDEITPTSTFSEESSEFTYKDISEDIVDSFDFNAFKETDSSLSEKIKNSIEEGSPTVSEEADTFEWDFGEADEIPLIDDEEAELTPPAWDDDENKINWGIKDEPQEEKIFDSKTDWNFNSEPSEDVLINDEKIDIIEDASPFNSFEPKDEPGGYSIETSNSEYEHVEDEPIKETSLKAEDFFTVNKHNFSPEQLRLIIEAAEKVNSNIKLDEVLKSIISAASLLTEADRGTLYILDRETNELWSKVVRGDNIQEIRLRIGQGLAGWVAQTGEVVNIQDATVDDRFDSDIDKSSGYKTNSMLCYPIKNKNGVVIGVLQLLNSHKGFFVPIDEAFLEALSVHAALALENAELVQQILRTDRLTSIGKVANFIITDIKKPILTIKHYAEHIKKKDITQDVKQVLDMIIEQANTVSDLVQTTLSYSEGKSILQTKKQSINATLEYILELLAEYVDSKKVKLFKKFDKDAIVQIDKKEFYQACFQIAKNACESMGTGGNLYISTTLGEASVSISFKDSGLGIPDSLIDKIWEPFMSHGKKNGVGLGLPIAEKIIKEHGGTIAVETDLGTGTTFTIKLPIVNNE
ncbi:MAG: GAF domain-containing protein [Ignavibacteria bacterium]|nr:GAF domain-containing protein [Ignavibacteria bacterium]